MRLFRYEKGWINLDMVTESFFSGPTEKDAESSATVLFAALDSDGDQSFTRLRGAEAERLRSYLDQLVTQQTYAEIGGGR